MLPAKYDLSYNVQWEVDSESGEGPAAAVEDIAQEQQRVSSSKPDWFCEAWLSSDLGAEAYTEDFKSHVEPLESEFADSSPLIKEDDQAHSQPLASTIGSKMTITQPWRADLVLIGRRATLLEQAASVKSATTFVTAFSSARSYTTARTRTSAQRADYPTPQLIDDPWMSTLHDRGLLQPPETELNWSGRGQHVEFSRIEEVPLVTKAILGHSNTAVVEAVRCRRIQLARKSIMCYRHFTRDDALVEVEHLHKLRHAHIVQLVGTYVLKRTFAILMYPATKFNLDTFMEMVCEEDKASEELRHVLAGFLRCLANALDYIHSQQIKHYDIKPKNLLVSEFYPARLSAEGTNLPHSTAASAEYRIYFADFGISHSFSAGQDITDSPISVTRKYCAPESADQAPRGTSADIFSLGCVYLEMLTICLGSTNDEFADYRGISPNSPYHLSIEESQQWSEVLQRRYAERLSPDKFLLVPCEEIFELVNLMLNEHFEDRPTTKTLVEALGTPLCCYKPPEPYVIDSDMG
jgi:hypothetical protein